MHRSPIDYHSLVSYGALEAHISRISVIRVLLKCSFVALPDTTPPTIGIEVTPRDPAAGPYVRVGDVVSATVTVSGAESTPTLLLFGGDRAAVTFNQSSPFLFSYTIQAGDNGQIAFAASVKDAAGNEATVTNTTGLTAGNMHYPR